MCVSYSAAHFVILLQINQRCYLSATVVIFLISESDETTGSVSTSERTSTQTDGKQDKTPGRPSKESSQQHSTKIQADAGKGKGEKTVQQEKPSKSDARHHSAAGSAKPQGKPGQDSGHRHKVCTEAHRLKLSCPD